ncbi:polysaccharide lyase family 7 protein [Shewanella maritima]|nr:polysaccharide lyase family 7 protein [Shewanella maritima]
MKKVIPLTIALAMTTVGCAATDTVVKPDFPMKPHNGVKVAPAEYKKFDSILSESKLQISEPNAKPGSKYELAKDSNFSGLVNEHFYVDQGSEALIVSMEGYKLRNELRVKNNFPSNLADTFYQLSADVMPIDPRGAMENSPSKNDAMTYLQVHNKGIDDDGTGYIPHPLLRIVYEKSRKGYNDYYWAIIKNNAVNCSSKSGNKGSAECKNAYLKLPLTAYDSEQPTHFDIIVGDQKLVVKVDGVTKVNHDISYWKHLLSYFKAGVYNQFENGKGEAHFYNLEYKVNKIAP